MRGLRQLVQVLDPRLGPAAARAQQIPAHDHDAEALRGEEQLDSVLGRRVPKSRHRQRANAAQGHDRRMQQKLGKLGREAVARRIASKVGDQRSEAATRGRFCGFTRGGAGKMVRRFRLADHPLDGAEAFVAFAPDLPGQLRQQSQHAEAFELGGEDHPASGALRMNLGGSDEAAERAVDEMAGLRQPAVLLPLAELLLPFHPQRTVFDAGEAVDAAVSIGALFDLVRRHAGDLVDARAVRDKGPDRLRRLGEVPFLAVAIDTLHAQHFQTGRCESRQRRKYVKPG
jgi:hypothetical protein